ncbi:hypothetical protein C943_02000 [Mariniradius saccharolyticus AK6]|uniref:Lipoprotein n=2 Tax=Mariniradius TaxID=1245590 RepID=M7X9Z0_9BACT|nr:MULTISPECIES: hypothetical protein [Mariniradius]EMS31729.1 hypothetical protein C943_02000 [Mariniradius saccharolyticus AK6]MCF1752128.1 hypothetical protein [Mariniradius sediminis]
MKKANLAFILLLSFTAMMVFSSCKSEDPEEENEGEVITEVTLRFTEVDPVAGLGTPFEVKASDPQGLESGSAPTIGTINLTKGKTYRLEISLFNGIANEDITEEIEEEKEEHQFYFLGTAFVGSPVGAYTYGDEDANGNPVGLLGAVTLIPTPGFNNATFRLILRHDLDKNFPGANNPHWQNFTQAGGETDLDISFPLVLN